MPAGRRRGWGGLLTYRDQEVLGAYIRLGRKRAADYLGIKDTSLRRHMTEINERLGTEDKWQAAYVIGWLHLDIPPEYDVEARSVPVKEKKPGDRRATRPVAIAPSIDRASTSYQPEP